MNIKPPNANDIPKLRALWKEAFSDTDEFLDVFFSCAFSADRSFCIKDKSEVVAALYVFDCLFENSKIAYIYAVATAKSHRGKGLCHRLMEHTHNTLKAKGYKGAILVPGSKSLFDFYEKMGYKTCCHLREENISAKENSESLKKITSAEYASLRRKFLPEGGVIQEGENLTFLSTYAEFYKGEDFIMASSKENSTLICHELLGNCEKFPYILSALGCKSGHFRTTGKDTPFAMYLPFEGEKYPSYFGFAFD